MDDVEKSIASFLEKLNAGNDVEREIIILREKKFLLITEAGKGRRLDGLVEGLDLGHPGEILQDGKSDVEEVKRVVASAKKINEALLKLFKRELKFDVSEVEELKKAAGRLTEEERALIGFYSRNKNKINLTERERRLLEQKGKLARDEENERRAILSAIQSISIVHDFFERFKSFIEEEINHLNIILESVNRILVALSRGGTEHKSDISRIRYGVPGFLVQFKNELNFYQELAGHASARNKILGEVRAKELARESEKESLEAVQKGKLRVLIIPCNWGFGPVSKAVAIVNSLKKLDSVLDGAGIVAAPDVCRAAKRGYSKIKIFELSDKCQYDRTEGINQAELQLRISNFIELLEKIFRDFKPNLVIDSLGYLGAPLAKMHGIKVIKLDHLFPELSAHPEDHKVGMKLLSSFMLVPEIRDKEFKSVLIKSTNLRAFEWLGDVLADHLIVPAFFPIEITPSVLEHRQRKEVTFVNPSMNGDAKVFMEYVFEIKSKLRKVLTRINERIRKTPIFSKTILISTGGIFKENEYPKAWDRFMIEINALVKTVASMNKKNKWYTGVVIAGSFGFSEKFLRYIKEKWTNEMRDCLIIAGNLRFNNMIRVYLSADLIVTNAGQTSISELISLNRPFLLLSPYQFEMIRNFEYTLKMGAGLAIQHYLDKSGNLKPEFEKVLTELLDVNSDLHTRLVNRQKEISGDSVFLDQVLVKIISEILGFEVGITTGYKEQPKIIAKVKGEEIKDLISVIIPCYNSSIYLLALIESIISQTYKNFEVIIVNDGSTDPKTIKELARIKEKYPWIKIITYAKNRNANYARNRGFQESKGSYLLFCDSDIILYKECLREFKSALDLNPSGSFSYCNFEREAIQEGLEPHRLVPHIAKPFDMDNLMRANYISTVSLIRRESFTGFDIFLKRHQDWDLFLTMARRGAKGVWINKFLFKDLQRKESISGNGKTDRLNSAHIIYSKHGIFSFRSNSKYAIIMPTHNQEDKTIRCLMSLNENTPVNYHLFWVDDNSRPDSRKAVARFLDSSKMPHTKILRNGENPGFIGSVNIALARIQKIKGFTHFVILNNDIVLTRGWIDKLLYPMLMDNLIMATGPVTSKAAWQTPKGIEKVCNVSLPPYTLSNNKDDIEAYNMQLARNVKERYKYITVLSFFCTLFNVNLIEKIGGLDARYGMGYADDDDYCLRILKVGYRIAVCLDTFIYHDHGSSFNAIGKRQALIAENHKIFEQKWGHKPQPARSISY